MQLIACDIGVQGTIEYKNQKQTKKKLYLCLLGCRKLKMSFAG